VLVTHDLRLAAEADRVILINEGRVVADGAPRRMTRDDKRLARPAAFQTD
jgi:ABC-type hemin transport system ATPase subunit